MLDKSTKKKGGRMCKIGIGTAGMKQDDTARVFNVYQSVVGRPLKNKENVAILRKGNGLH